MGTGCQRNGHRLRPIICRVMAAANQGVVVYWREVCRYGCAYIRQLANYYQLTNSLINIHWKFHKICLKTVRNIWKNISPDHSESDFRCSQIVVQDASTSLAGVVAVWLLFKPECQIAYCSLWLFILHCSVYCEFVEWIYGLIYLFRIITAMIISAFLCDDFSPLWAGVQLTAEKWGGGRGRHGHLSVMMSGAGDKYLDPVCNIFIATTQH